MTEFCSGLQKATEKPEEAPVSQNSESEFESNFESAKMLNLNWYYTPEQNDPGLCQMITRTEYQLPHIGNVTRFHRVIDDHSVMSIVSFFIIMHLDLHDFHPHIFQFVIQLFFSISKSFFT